MISYTGDIILASYFHCRKSGTNVSLLPIDHARAFPLSFDVENRKITNGELNFYNQPFHSNFKPDNFIDPSKCKTLKGSKNSSELIIYNVLDNCFGHSFLKLLMAIEENTRSKQDGLLIVPTSLAHFVKKDMFKHTIEINLNYKELELCWVLSKVIEPFLTMGYNTQLYPVHTYGVFDRDLLFNGLDVVKPKADANKSRICFYYRKDNARKWADQSQSKNITALFEELKKFFDESIRFTVIGAKDDSFFPSWIEDQRVSSFSATNDTKECNLLSESLIVISVTGSHMLIPSLLSNLTVHLHPVYKYKNMAEDVVNFTKGNIKLQPYQHVYYFGNSNCSDITPEGLAYKVLLHFQGLAEKTYKQTATENSQKEWISKQFPYLKYAELNKHRSLINNKKDPVKRILSKIRSIFG